MQKVSPFFVLLKTVIGSVELLFGYLQFLDKLLTLVVDTGGGDGRFLCSHGFVFEPLLKRGNLNTIGNIQRIPKAFRS